MNDWKNSPITRRADGSYVIAYAGFPEYHVPNNEEFAELWAQVEAYTQEHPEQVTEEPAPAEPTEEELLARVKARKESEFADVDNKQRNELIELSVDLLAAAINPQAVSDSEEDSAQFQEKQTRFFQIRQVRAENRQRKNTMLAATTVASAEVIIPITLDEPDTPVVQGYTI